MNLRLSDGVARFRISRIELERLLSAGEIAAHTVFPGGKRLAYRIAIAPENHESICPLGLEWQGDEILVHVPKQQAQDLLARPPAKDVGCYQDLAIENGQTLKLELEVDFFKQKPKASSSQSSRNKSPL